MTLRDEFIKSLPQMSAIELFLQNNNAAYIMWLETKLRATTHLHVDGAKTEIKQITMEPKAGTV